MDFQRGIVNRGNTGPLRRALDRAAAGEGITLGFLGGSITQGSLASEPESCYAALVSRWFARQYPYVRYVNAGIGGTTSQFGAARVREDLLSHQPDIVFVEFSVNDEPTDHFRETYEGLVRTILKSGAPMVLIHNAFYDTGRSAEDIHLPVGRHYGLPCLSVRESIWREIAAGTLAAGDITPDNLHPNDRGHELLARLITEFLSGVQRDEPGDFGPLPAPITPNHYENSIRYRCGNADPILLGFRPDPNPQTHITQMFRRGYTAWNYGDSIRFSIESACLAVQYRKSVRHPAPIAKVIVDGDEENGVLLDGNFRETWGDCLHIDTILTHGPLKKRTVEIRIVSSGENAVPFYLASVIGSSQAE